MTMAESKKKNGTARSNAPNRRGRIWTWRKINHPVRWHTAPPNQMRNTLNVAKTFGFSKRSGAVSRGGPKGRRPNLLRH